MTPFSITSYLRDALHALWNLSSDVRRDESFTVLLFLLNILLVLVAYYVIKTVREPLILASGGSAELKSYAAGVQVGVLLLYLPVYDWISSKVGRLQLNISFVAFFIVCIQLFFFAGYFEWPNLFGVLGEASLFSWLSANITLGFVFYIWVGIFSLSTIAQFWSYANDLFDEEAGERLFPVIAIGATLGAPIGSFVAGRVFSTGVDPYAMLQISAVLLVVHLGLYVLIENRHCQKRADDEGIEFDEALEEATEEISENKGGFQLVWENRYLQWIALFFILLNLVNTTGEYVLSVYVKNAAEAAVASGQVEQTSAYIGQFYGDFYFVVNIITVIIQAFIVSRLLRWLGMKGVIFALPIIAFGTYGLVVAGVGLPIYRWAKTAENSTDYSIMNTTRALVWLPTTRPEQYTAKQTIDTIFVRFGDVLSAGLVLIGNTVLVLGPRGFALTNLIIIVVWIGVGYLMLRKFWERSKKHGISKDDLLNEADDQ